MTSFLLKFEAIESRIASYSSCPRGTSSRVHALRLRRCFQNYSRRRQSTAIEERHAIAAVEPLDDSNVDTVKIHKGESGGAVLAEKHGGFRDLSLRDMARREHEAAGEISLRGRFQHRNQIMRIRRIWGWNMGVDRHSLPNLGEQDVLPVQFSDGVRVECSPNENALYRALRIGDPHLVLKELMSLVRFDGFNYYSKVLQTLSSNTFSEILRCLDPQYFVGRYGKFHEELSQNDAWIMGLPLASRHGYHRFSMIFLSQIHGIIKARQRDHPLSLSDHKYLLKCARATGNIKAAQEVWMSMTSVSSAGPNGPVTPDGDCFKHYLATMTWSDPSSPYLKNRLRVIPDNIEPRSWAKPPYTLKGHRVGPDRGIKVQVSQIFRQMVQAGVPGDEEMFCLMMMGFAREGDMNSVELTLRRVWGVDVDALLTVDESEMEPVKPYALDSPFYPSAKILHTISHAYSINNDIPTALRVVDYVSRQYNIKIPTSVWSELLEWTFILSKKRHGGRVERDGTSTGQLPQVAVNNIWATLTSDPYNIKPTMEMYDKFISSLLHRQRFGEVKTVMSEARRLHITHVRSLSRQHILLKSTFKPGHPVSEKRMRDLQYYKMRVMRNRAYIRSWVRLLISRASVSLRYNDHWSAHDLPKLLKEWNLFIPKRVDYPIATGNVRFWTDVVVDNGAQQRKWRVGYKWRERRFISIVGREFKKGIQRGDMGRWERRQSLGIVRGDE
jgi:hypothetical protein